MTLVCPHCSQRPRTQRGLYLHLATIHHQPRAEAARCAARIVTEWRRATATAARRAAS
jgi:hypothetical protein